MPSCPERFSFYAKSPMRSLGGPRSLSHSERQNLHGGSTHLPQGFEKQVFMLTGTIREHPRLIFFNPLQERNKDAPGELPLGFLVGY